MKTLKTFLLSATFSGLGYFYLKKYNRFILAVSINLLCFNIFDFCGLLFNFRGYVCLLGISLTLYIVTIIDSVIVGAGIFRTHVKRPCCI